MAAGSASYGAPTLPALRTRTPAACTLELNVGLNHDDDTLLHAIEKERGNHTLRSHQHDRVAV